MKRPTKLKPYEYENGTIWIDGKWAGNATSLSSEEQERIVALLNRGFSAGWKAAMKERSK